MSHKTNSDSEAIAAYKQQARERRMSSKLRSVEQVPKLPQGVTMPDAIAPYHVSFSTEGVVRSREGKVTIRMKGAKPLTQTEAVHLFGKSRVMIPEYTVIKEDILTTDEKSTITRKNKLP